MKIIRSRLINLVILFSFFTMTALVISCADSSSPESAQGELKLTMVDAPAGYDEVNIVVTRVEIHKAGSDSSDGWFVLNNNESTYDLLTLTNGASVVLGNANLDVGKYTQIRLIIGNGSNLVVDGVTNSLEIASGEESGVKLNHSFDIEAGVLYELTLDFDADKSIVLTGSGQYKLKPVIRLVPVVISGTISGNIKPATALSYLYAINGTDTVSTIANPVTGYFKLMALLEQTYRVEVFATNSIYKDTTVTNVMVIAEQNKNLGDIILSLK